MPKFIQSILLVGTLCGLGFSAFASVGNVTQQTGTGLIKRAASEIDTEVGTGVEMDDKVKTFSGKMGLTFEDDTQVQITENSSLVIDDFVYDPNAKTGKLALNVALGTVRYASGNIAKHSRESVRLRTPTASISVRGTDFTMTVDEVGKSLIILLPSCPANAKSEEECYVGEIMVETDTGYVILNQAYQATVADNHARPPSDPVILDIDPLNINNMLIVVPPKEIYADENEYATASELDQDLLEFKDLDVNELEKEELAYGELDLNRLDGDFLENVLDAIARQLALNIEQLTAQQDALNERLPNIKNSPETKFIVDDVSTVLMRESASHIAEVRVGAYTNGTVITEQDSIPNTIQLNTGGDNVSIKIYQSN